MSYRGQPIIFRVDAGNHQSNSWSYDDSLSRCTSSTTRDGTGCELVAYVSASQVNVQDAYGKQRIYTIAQAGRRYRVSEVDAPAARYSASNAVGWRYDSSGRLVEIRYGGGRIDRFSGFDSRGNPANVTLGAGDLNERRIAFTWHPSVNVPLSRSEPSVLLEGGVKETIFDFDASGDGSTPNQNPSNLCRRVIENGYTTDSQGTIVSYRYTTSYAYNAKGQVTSVDGPLSQSGDLVGFTYDSSTGNLQSIDNPLVGSVQFSLYSGVGLPGRKTDANGQSEQYAYDVRGRLAGVTHLSDNKSRTISYTLSGQVHQRIDEDGVGDTFSYDATTGRLSSVEDGNGNTIHFTYDGQGNVIQKEYRDSFSAVVRRYGWSFQHPQYPGLPYRQTQSDGSFSEYGYDGAGNVVSFKTPSGNTTTYAYNVFGLKTGMTRPGNVATSFDYDAHGNLCSVTNGENFTTRYVRDDMGRVVLESSPERGQTRYGYNAAGKVATRTDARGITLTYAYDALSRPLSVTSPAGTSLGSENALSISYIYDQGTYGKGRLTHISDPSGETSFIYDARGRVQEKVSAIPGGSYSLFRTLSPAGRLTSLVYPSGRIVDYVYDVPCGCKVQSIRTTLSGPSLSVLENLAYEPFSGAQAMSFGNGGAVVNVSSLDGRLLHANVGRPGRRDYTYDADGRLASVSAPASPGFSRSFSYDSLGQLSRAEGSFGNGFLEYGYDKAGNRLLETRAIGTSAGTADDLVFAYNQLGELARVQKAAGGAVAVSFAYNALGQRVKKGPNPAATTSATMYFYDFEGNLLGEIDSTGAIVREYIYRGNSRVGFIEGGNLYYFHNDTTGNPVLVTGANRQVVWEAIYEPFGLAFVNSASTIENNFRFQGQYSIRGRADISPPIRSGLREGSISMRMPGVIRLMLWIRSGYLIL